MGDGVFWGGIKGDRGNSKKGSGFLVYFNIQASSIPK